MTGPSDVSAAEDWTLITVTYNSADVLRAFWSVTRLGGVRWVVVDNASTDGSTHIARSLGAEVLEMRGNVGFGAANNRALAEVTTPYVAFVNPDVTVDMVDLSRLEAVSRANGDALVAPQLLNPDGTEQPNARGLPFLADKIAHRAGGFPGSRLEEYVRTGLAGPTFCAWVMGAAVAGPTHVFRQLGGWDERYFIYYEDHDLGLRSWQQGHPVVLDPVVRWAHGWQRATTRVRLSPWRHELRSGRQFYATYPWLLWRRWGRRPSQTLQATLVGSKTWRNAHEAPLRLSQAG
jgi:GT2 family glycosyltransferase